MGERTMVRSMLEMVCQFFSPTRDSPSESLILVFRPFPWPLFDHAFNKPHIQLNFVSILFTRWTQVCGHIRASRNRPAHLCHPHWRGAEGDWDSHLWSKKEASLASKRDQEETWPSLSRVKVFNSHKIKVVASESQPRATLSYNSHISSSCCSHCHCQESTIYWKPDILSNQGEICGHGLKLIQFYVTWNLLCQVLTSSPRSQENKINKSSKNTLTWVFEHWIWLLPLDHSLIFANNCNFLQT